MNEIKLQVSINVIIHATENSSKILEKFEEIFGVTHNEFTSQNTTGHFNNPIVILTLQVGKLKAKQFIEKFVKLLSKEQRKKLIDEIEERTENSKFHVRLDKQEFVSGKISFEEKDSIKIKIQTPIYNKKNTKEIFGKIFQLST